MLRKAALVSIVTMAANVFAPPVMSDETGLDIIHAQQREGNKICMTTHFHSGSSSGKKTRKEAEAAAAHDWAGFTAWEYGTTWASHRLAASKSMECSQDGGTWSCYMKARPCKPAGSTRRAPRS